MPHIAIETKNLGKLYQLGERERYYALRDLLTKAALTPFRLLMRKGKSPDVRRYLWALKNVSIQIGQGQIVGIVGRNGAGKSTLLKILSRITRPTEGEARVYGRVASLLELGTGFHYELTGRENIFMNGAVLGMKKAEIERKFDEIVAFAEVEKFIDTPTKHYSTGMYMRLAFAVAAHLEPEILLVDEVLTVGDLAFQKKCLGKMGTVAHQGRTVLFVSHQMNQIRRLCEKCIWLERGQVLKEGPTAEVLADYEAAMAAASEELIERDGAGVKARFLRWELEKPSNGDRHMLADFEPVVVKFLLRVNRPIKMGVHGIGLHDVDGRMLWGTAATNLEFSPGDYELCYELPMLPLKPGPYYWHVSLYDHEGEVDEWHCIPNLVLATEPVTHFWDDFAGILNLSYRFQISPERRYSQETQREA
ncbi:MAG: ABC transporter ATP-binding protein [Acidobacteria bacterium]|nr:ABC transporter ATP-binding protein [Acidobacteriota bacterium]